MNEALRQALARSGLDVTTLADQDSDDFAEQVGLHAAVARSINLHHGVAGTAWALPTKNGRTATGASATAMKPLQQQDWVRATACSCGCATATPAPSARPRWWRWRCWAWACGGGVQVGLRDTGRSRDRPGAVVQPPGCAAQRRSARTRARRQSRSNVAAQQASHPFEMRRRHWLALAPACIAWRCWRCRPRGRAARRRRRVGALPAAAALAHAPNAATDEGGLWALMDREEAACAPQPLPHARRGGLPEYLQGAGAASWPASTAPDVRVYALRTPFFNASMAPNGMMQVWSGLLLRLENEAQLCSRAWRTNSATTCSAIQLSSGCATPRPARAFGTFMIMAFGAGGRHRLAWPRWPAPSASRATRSARPTRSARI